MVQQLQPQNPLLQPQRLHEAPLLALQLQRHLVPFQSTTNYPQNLPQHR